MIWDLLKQLREVEYFLSLYRNNSCKIKIRCDQKVQVKKIKSILVRGVYEIQWAPTKIQTYNKIEEVSKLSSGVI